MRVFPPLFAQSGFDGIHQYVADDRVELPFADDVIVALWLPELALSFNQAITFDRTSALQSLHHRFESCLRRGNAHLYVHVVGHDREAMHFDKSLLFQR